MMNMTRKMNITREELERAFTTMNVTREKFEESIDEQIARLTAHPDEIPQTWSEGDGLFRFLFPFDCKQISWLDAMQCGCPTLVKGGGKIVYRNEQLTHEIRSMDLPFRGEDIRVHHFPLMKNVQLKWYDECKNQV